MTTINNNPCLGKGADGVPIYKCPDVTGQKRLDVLLFDARKAAAESRAATAKTAPPDVTVTPPQAPPSLPKGIKVEDIPTAEDLGLGDVLTTSTPAKVAEPPRVEEPPKEPPKEEPIAADAPPPPPTEAPVNSRAFTRGLNIKAPEATQGASARPDAGSCTGGINTGSCLGTVGDGKTTRTVRSGGAEISQTYDVNDVGNTSGIKLGCDERYFKKGDCDKPIQKPEKKK